MSSLTPRKAREAACRYATLEYGGNTWVTNVVIQREPCEHGEDRQCVVQSVTCISHPVSEVWGKNTCTLHVTWRIQRESNAYTERAN